MRVNLGCGDAYLEGWVNVDENPAVRADVRLDAFDFFAAHSPEVDEVYMGHFLEHLFPSSAIGLLRLIRESVRPGTLVSAVVPDMRAIFAAYDAGEITNEELNERFVYSYEQPSHHVWCYDAETLGRVFTEAGFGDVEPIDPRTWDPVFWKRGPESRWQCGVRATTPEPDAVPPPLDEPMAREYPEPVTAETEVSSEELLLARVRALREAVLDERRERQRLIEATPPGPPPPGSPEQSSGPTPVLSARSNEFLGWFAPRGSRARSILSAGWWSLRETRNYARELRHTWSQVGIAEGGPVQYATWRRSHDATKSGLRRQRELAETIAEPIGVHVVVLADNPDRPLSRTLGSIVGQSWTHVTATVLGTRAAAQIVSQFGDPRLHFRSVGASTPISVANGIIPELDDRDFTVFVAAGDQLAPDCCFWIAETARDDPALDLISFDDDLLGADGHRHDPRFRPAPSPETLLGANYLGRSFAMRNRRFVVTAGLRDGLGDGAWWDLVLRADLRPYRMARVPLVLAHVTERVDGAPDTSVSIVAEHLGRLGMPARPVATPGCVRIDWQLDRLPPVTIVVPTRHNRPMLEQLLPGLAVTDYPDLEVVMIDNGERTPEREAWYDRWSDLELRVEWWTEPFNYSAVNNHGAALARGEVLVFLNDDIEVPDPTWLRELVGWATRPEIGTVGLQLTASDGTIQHGGVVLGLNGFADHLFEGMAPGSPSLLGPTTWYRNVLAVTAACVAVRRSVFDEIGGFDERFRMCGSDVVLGLDAIIAGYRNVCSPFGRVRHHEAATRGTDVPVEDFFASYWRYQRWIIDGDPYFSPGLSLLSRTPKLKSKRERPPSARLADTLNRPMTVFRQRGDADEASMLADMCRITETDVQALRARHQANGGVRPPKTVNWFLPDIDSPFYGGINTALRIADQLARVHGVQNRFVVWSDPNESYIRSALAAVFPSLAAAPIVFHDNSTAALEQVPDCDVAIATMWTTAYSVARFPHTGRGFYLLQDFEPMFYPAGTLYALAEETYRLGLYGLCNTPHLLDLYEQEYGGHGGSFLPAVDQAVFHAEGRPDPTRPGPATVFVYSRPGHWRNSWELASLALTEAKDRLGDQVRIVTAGSWARPDDLGSGIRHLGMLDYKETGALYRRCDVGVALTLSEHPSYLPLEFMACGTTVVAFDNPAGHWLLRDDENAVLTRRTVDGLAESLERTVRDPQLRRRLSEQGLRDIAAHHSSWEKALSGVYGVLSDPMGGSPGR